MATFDISSEFNKQEVTNAVDQCHREISNRYDFRDTNTSVSLMDSSILLKSSTLDRMLAAEQVLREKLKVLRKLEALQKKKFAIVSCFFKSSCFTHCFVVLFSFHLEHVCNLLA